MIVGQLLSMVASRFSPRTRAVLLVSFILALVVVATLVPQFSVSACSVTGYCPCPGC